MSDHQMNIRKTYAIHTESKAVPNGCGLGYKLIELNFIPNAIDVKQSNVIRPKISLISIILLSLFNDCNVFNVVWVVLMQQLYI